MDEFRISDVLRYDGPFDPPTAPFEPDDNTRLLFHFDEGSGATTTDASQHPDGPNDGEFRVGGAPEGPIWSDESPFG